MLSIPTTTHDEVFVLKHRRYQLLSYVMICGWEYLLKWWWMIGDEDLWVRVFVKMIGDDDWLVIPQNNSIWYRISAAVSRCPIRQCLWRSAPGYGPGALCRKIQGVPALYRLAWLGAWREPRTSSPTGALGRRRTRRTLQRHNITELTTTTQIFMLLVMDITNVYY